MNMILWSWNSEWFNFSIGTYLRRQKDKRHYLGLFNSTSEISGLKKFFLLVFRKHVNYRESISSINGIIDVDNIYDFFSPILNEHDLVSKYILSHISSNLLKEVDAFDFNNTVGVHIRLGDFPESRRTPLQWYIEKINRHNNRRVLIFSDGTKYLCFTLALSL